MSLPRVLIKRALVEVLEKDGWLRDRYGHHQKQRITKVVRDDGVAQLVPKDYRVVLNELSCRIEVKHHTPATQFSRATSSWLRIGGDYYSNMKLLPDGRIRIGTYFVGREKSV